jgi:hypothetical protein
MTTSKKTRPRTAASRIVQSSPADQGRAPEKPPQFPAIPVASVLSFLKDTRGALDWNIRDMMDSLMIAEQEAGQVASILHMQGYVKPALDTGHWLTTPAGEDVSGSKAPRFKLDRVEEALSQLAERIKSINQDRHARFHISDAVAYGDFLLDRPMVQAADVGIRLEAAKGQPADRSSSRETLAFLKALRNKTPALQLQPYQPWMSERSHRRLV